MGDCHRCCEIKLFKQSQAPKQVNCAGADGALTTFADTMFDPLSGNANDSAGDEQDDDAGNAR